MRSRLPCRGWGPESEESVRQRIHERGHDHAFILRDRNDSMPAGVASRNLEREQSKVCAHRLRTFDKVHFAAWIARIHVAGVQ